ncbi:MAG TPA: ABC transporter permease [Ignavibacteria bacterium]|nr:ABC transporter permease [Ignavibacteria bacterium]HAX47586.1 ABC transporter permease [Bacteroidota bacterium]HRE11173.1 ABC transporter permease [Ignavibacteria bacterium]HRF64785.1 ABC transporter permease [Ignavibacteria bacterium]HRJ05206.1 ABC transporter permease [Ignavibacteria bacterium]
MRFFREVFKPPYNLNEIIKQFFQIGNKSLGLVGITGFIIGFVLALQAIPTLQPFGATSLIPSMVGLGIILEIGPVITGLICAGKIGSSIGAELGSMKVTEQIDAMEVSASNPFNFLVISRVIATSLMIPLLIIYADAIALLGGYLAMNVVSDVSIGLYFTQVFDALDIGSLIGPVIKTFFFGFTIGIVGCYKGYNADKGTESVGVAANSSVVISSLMVIIWDMIAVQITNIIL